MKDGNKHRREEREDMGYQGLGKRNWTETCLSLGQSSIDYEGCFGWANQENILLCDNDSYRLSFFATDMIYL